MSQPERDTGPDVRVPRRPRKKIAFFLGFALLALAAIAGLLIHLRPRQQLLLLPGRAYWAAFNDRREVAVLYDKTADDGTSTTLCAIFKDFATRDDQLDYRFQREFVVDDSPERVIGDAEEDSWVVVGHNIGFYSDSGELLCLGVGGKEQLRVDDWAGTDVVGMIGFARLSDGEYLTGSYDGVVTLWKREGRRLLPSRKVGQLYILAFDVGEIDATQVAVICQSELGTWDRRKDAFTTIRLGSLGREIEVKDGVVLVATEEVVYEMKGAKLRPIYYGEEISRVKLVRNGKFVLVADAGQCVLVDVSSTPKQALGRSDSRSILRSRFHHTEPPYVVNFDRSGNRRASLTPDGKIVIIQSPVE